MSKKTKTNIKRKSNQQSKINKFVHLFSKHRPAAIVSIVLALTIVGFGGLEAYKNLSGKASATVNYWTAIDFNNTTFKVCTYTSSSNTPRIRVKIYNPTPQVRWAQLIVNTVDVGSRRQHQYQRIEPVDFNKIKDYPDRSGGTPRTFYAIVNIGVDQRTKGINFNDINKCDKPKDVPNGARWDRVAQCESSGNWELNTGNGFYGGLQFYLSTWRAYGGIGRPDQNSREEQIRIAERVRLTRGSVTADWPRCGRYW